MHGGVVGLNRTRTFYISIFYKFLRLGLVLGLELVLVLDLVTFLDNIALLKIANS